MCLGFAVQCAAKSGMRGRSLTWEPRSVEPLAVLFASSVFPCCCGHTGVRGGQAKTHHKQLSLGFRWVLKYVCLVFL